MCMDERNEFGETFVYFAQMERYLRLSKNLQFCELRYSIYILLKIIEGPMLSIITLVHFV